MTQVLLNISPVPGETNTGNWLKGFIICFIVLSIFVSYFFWKGVFDSQYSVARLIVAMMFGVDGTFMRLLSSYDLCVVRGLHKPGAIMAIVFQALLGMLLAAVFVFVVGEKNVATLILSENLVRALASQTFASSVVLGLAGGLMVPNIVSKLGAAHTQASST